MRSPASSHSSFREEYHQDVFIEPDREIKCPVHGYIPVSKLITSIIDTPQFQRLRYLKQLGTSYFVWPGASHNRFEHSLGVFHLSRMMVTRLRNAQPELNITDRDVTCVEVAGLCHDLGHGPFSHLWDNEFIPRALPGTTWKHEDASEMMLDYLVRDNNIELQPDEVDFIKDLISGNKKHTLSRVPPEKGYLFEIVANKRNGIDVDKFDYIARDTHAISNGTDTDLIRLINSARVVDGQICYSEKNAATVFGLFQERFKLHKTIYHHKTAKSLEFMIVDALLMAEPYLNFAERIHDPKRFMHLNDSILLEIERSECPELEQSRQIIHRIRKRDLYRLVDKEFLRWENRDIWKERFTPEKIVEAAKQLEDQDPGARKLIEELTKDHVIVDMAALHHGMGNRFPLDTCKFYGKYSPNEAFPVRPEADVSHLLPKGFGEVWNRIFTRDQRFYGVIQAGGRALMKTMPSHDSSPLDVVHTPVEPRTPVRETTSSMSSILSESGTTIERGTFKSGLKTPAASGSLGSISSSSSATTPKYNSCLTVPMTFTPKGSTGARSVKPRGKKRKDSVLDLDDIDEADDASASGSPKRKKRS